MIIIYETILAVSVLISFACLVFTLSNFVDISRGHFSGLGWKNLKAQYQRRPVRGTLAFVSLCIFAAILGTWFFPVEITPLFIERTAYLRVCLIAASVAILKASGHIDDLEIRIRQQINEEQQRSLVKIRDAKDTEGV